MSIIRFDVSDCGKIEESPSGKFVKWDHLEAYLLSAQIHACESGWTAEESISRLLWVLRYENEIHGINKRLRGNDEKNVSNGHREKPELFKTVLAGCVKRKPIKYGNWTIEYNPKCIVNWDWDYVHDDHDGEQWSCGCAKSVEACINEINNKELDIAEGIYE